MNKYRVLVNASWYDSKIRDLVSLYPDQEIWKGADDHSLCIANPKGDGCAPDKQWVATVKISMDVNERIATLLNAGMIEEIQDEADQ